MRVRIPSRQADAILSRVAVSADVTTWSAVDNVTLSFRQGVLVASRGLGFDLMGADAQATLDAFAGRGEETYRRQMRYLTGEHHSTYLTAGCRMARAGSEGNKELRLQRFDEHCKASDNKFTNSYWLDGSGNVVRSKQWVSPEIGYISTEIRKN